MSWLGLNPGLARFPMGRGPGALREVAGDRYRATEILMTGQTVIKGVKGHLKWIACEDMAHKRLRDQHLNVILQTITCH